MDAYFMMTRYLEFQFKISIGLPHDYLWGPGLNT
jgi:hypothetical protein